MTTLAELAAAEATLNAKLETKTYKVICVSVYHDDITELDAKVARLKARGWTNMNKSLLVRLALRKIDAETMEVPRR